MGHEQTNRATSLLGLLICTEQTSVRARRNCARLQSSLLAVRPIGSGNNHSRNQFNILGSQAKAEANGIEKLPSL
jgi:hypothetical protein